jgi:hypothetical protein
MAEWQSLLSKKRPCICSSPMQAEQFWWYLTQANLCSTQRLASGSHTAAAGPIVLCIPLEGTR